MSEKEISLSFEELHHMEVYCPKCKTGILFNVSDKASIPTRCCSCHDDLPQHICTAMRSYREFFRNAMDSTAELKFRIKAPN